MQRFQLFSLVMFHALLAGCVAAPVGLPDEEPFLPEKIRFLEGDQVTREQVYDFFADFTVSTDDGDVQVSLEPVKFANGRWWLYGQDRELSSWFFLLIGGGGYFGYIDGGVAEFRSDHYVLIEFDDNDYVRNFKLAEIRADACDDSGICRRDGNVVLFLPEAAVMSDDSALQSLPATCAIYVYSAVNRSIHADIEGASSAHLMHPDLYGLWLVSPGDHKVRVVTSYRDGTHRSLDAPARSAAVTCQQGDKVYVRFRESTFMRRPILEQVDNDEGRRAIDERHMVLIGE
jgi:hypothetical protein